MEDLERHLQRQLHWIGAADAKVGPVFAIDTAMLAVLSALIPERQAWSIFPAIVAALSGLLLLGSIIALAVATFPRTKGPKGSVLFFGGISDYDEEEFIRRITMAPTEDMRRDYARQIYRNAQIATAKYRFVKFAMIGTFSAVIPWLLAIYALY